jgi:hypothetical protein
MSVIGVVSLTLLAAPTAAGGSGGTPAYVPLALNGNPAAATPTLAPAPATATATQTQPAAPAQVIIQTIDYNPAGEDLAGENVTLVNQGGPAASMTGWTLCDAAAHCYTFPAFVLTPGATVRVWTKAGANTATDLYWASNQAIWNNDGDTATLRNAINVVVATYSY